MLARILMTVVCFAIAGCSSFRKKESQDKTALYSGLVGSCLAENENQQMKLCFEYSYSTVAASDPKESAIEELKTSCANAKPTEGQWTTDEACSEQDSQWICEAEAKESETIASLKLVIGGQGASEENATKVCSAYDGRLVPIDSEVAPVNRAPQVPSNPGRDNSHTPLGQDFKLADLSSETNRILISDALNTSDAHQPDSSPGNYDLFIADGTIVSATSKNPPQSSFCRLSWYEQETPKMTKGRIFQLTQVSFYGQHGLFLYLQNNSDTAVMECSIKAVSIEQATIGDFTATVGNRLVFL